MPTFDLAGLGWSAHFLSQLSPDELSFLAPARVAEVHRNRVVALAAAGAMSLPPPAGDPLAVGDWVLSDGGRIRRRLARLSLLSRRAAGTAVGMQPLAANVDTAFIVTSCNAEFNPRRLERYLSLAAAAGVRPVAVLTKADLVSDPEAFRAAAGTLARGLAVVVLDARAPGAASALADWTGRGQTVVLLGSSGVGKTTLANALTGQHAATGDIRRSDDRGRHTTTARALRPLAAGGWIIDTPGLRELQLTGAAEGIDHTFADVAELVGQCRFRDCRHEGEPGCAVRAAVEAGELDPARLAAWQKLRTEDRRNGMTLAQARAEGRRFGRMARQVMRGKSRRRSDWQEED